MPPTLVRVTNDDILEGEAGNCGRCPVALATARATGGEVLLYEDPDWQLRIEVDGRSVRAPAVVRDFVRAFDDQPRDLVDGRLDTSDPDCRPPEPIEFALPEPADPSWKMQCEECHRHFDPDELDDDSLCEDCR